MRPEESLDPGWKLHACAGIRKKELLADGHVKHSPHYTQFLMYGRCLQYAFLNESNLRLHLHPLLEPSTKIRLNIVGVHAREFGVFEHASQVFQRALVNFVCLLRAEGSGGIASARKYSHLDDRAIGSSTRNTCATDRSTALFSGVEGWLDSLLIDHSGGFCIAAIICCQKV